MVKVRIEHDRRVEELKGESIAAVIPEGKGAYQILMGDADAKTIAINLSEGVPKILKEASDNRLEYVFAMIYMHMKIGEKITKELKAGGVNPMVNALAKTHLKETQ